MLPFAPGGRALAAAFVLSAACAPGPAAVPPAASVPEVRFDAAAAEAALAIAGPPGDTGAAARGRLLATDGYRRLHRREAAMGRAFTDSAFLAFLAADSLAAHTPALRATLARWRESDVAAAGRRAAAYLPAATPLRAVIYPMVKPKPNSFVFDVGTDSAAIFMYLDPAVTAAKLENTLAHELHHVGMARACAEPADSALPEPARRARGWLGAFGEGVAVLAAAGGPGVHPHAASTVAERAVWERDLARVPEDLRRVERFLLDVLDGRLAGDAIRQQAMTFFGEAQGPWYTVGYTMAVAVERRFGRARLVEVLCDGPALLRAYDAAVAGRPGAPRWSPGLLRRLSP